MKKGLGGAGVLVLCLLLNAVLVGVQNLSHASDQGRLDQMKKQLETERVQIQSLETDLRSTAQYLDQMEPRFSTLEAEIKSIESTSPNGVPSSIYASYCGRLMSLTRLSLPIIRC